MLVEFGCPFRVAPIAWRQEAASHYDLSRGAQRRRVPGGIVGFNLEIGTWLAAARQMPRPWAAQDMIVRPQDRNGRPGFGLTIELPEPGVRKRLQQALTQIGRAACREGV